MAAAGELDEDEISETQGVHNYERRMPMLGAHEGGDDGVVDPETQYVNDISENRGPLSQWI